MEQVKVSPKFKVVIPKPVRESLGITPGQRFQVVRYGDRIELVPVRNIDEMRGFLTGIDTKLERARNRGRQAVG
ncbi:MAG: AbrB/MazE/SpoVT family DNA-binding domain-containing protein [Chromatiales bacterium]|nr:AbrB/MazE/SpoVT family DNA-binding domain-containing protein [Chromatiales bacterium]